MVQTTITTGITADKQALKKKLIQLMVSVSKGVKSYAHRINNMDLEMKVSFSSIDSRVYRDEKLVTTAQTVFSIATPFIDNLGSFGITDSQLSDLDAATNLYIEKMTEPKEARDARKICTAQL